MAVLAHGWYRENLDDFQEWARATAVSFDVHITPAPNNGTLGRKLNRVLAESAIKLQAEATAEEVPA